MCVREELLFLMTSLILTSTRFVCAKHCVNLPPTTHNHCVCVSVVVCVFQSQLIDGDLQLLQADLMGASLTDTSQLSFFEDFHISPIKVTTRFTPDQLTHTARRPPLAENLSDCVRVAS